MNTKTLLLYATVTLGVAGGRVFAHPCDELSMPDMAQKFQGLALSAIEVQSRLERGETTCSGRALIHPFDLALSQSLMLRNYLQKTAPCVLGEVRESGRVAEFQRLALLYAIAGASERDRRPLLELAATVEDSTGSVELFYPSLANIELFKLDVQTAETTQALSHLGTALELLSKKRMLEYEYVIARDYLGDVLFLTYGPGSVRGFLERHFADSVNPQLIRELAEQKRPANVSPPYEGYLPPDTPIQDRISSSTLATYRELFCVAK